MADKMKELDATTRGMIERLREMTIEEIKELQKEWLIKLECDHVSYGVYQYIEAVVDFVIKEKQQVA